MNPVLPVNPHARPRKILLGCVAENTHKYLSQALRLLRSVRWFGGALGGADVMICVAERVNSTYRDRFERLGASVCVVPRFDPANPYANKLQLFAQPEVALYDTVLYLDCDTLLVQDPTPYLEQSTFQAKIAPVPTVPTEIFVRLCEHFDLPMPELAYRTTFDNVPTIWYCNAGVLIVPVESIPKLVPTWGDYARRLSANLDLLGTSRNHCGQASLTLAYITSPIPFSQLPVIMNFLLNMTHLEAPSAVVEGDPVILHYHDRVDAGGYLMPSPYPRAQERIRTFNDRLRALMVSEAGTATYRAAAADVGRVEVHPSSPSLFQAPNQLPFRSSSAAAVLERPCIA